MYLVQIYMYNTIIISNSSFYRCDHSVVRTNNKMNSDERFSIHVSKTLDCIGYKRDMVADRVRWYAEFSKITSLFPAFFWIIFAGSKGEGLSAPDQSDIDGMVVFNDILCSGNPGPRDTLTYPTVFQMDCHNSPPGYTKLKLIKPTVNDQFGCFWWIVCEGGGYISSQMFKYIAQSMSWNFNQHMEGVLSMENASMHTNGPALTHSHMIRGIKHDCDSVYCVPCKHFYLIDAWKNRCREYNWPPLEMVLNAQNIDTGGVVPVGPKGSDAQHLEWRICFTKMEMKLIHSFNDTQIKLYVLVKKVSKEILKPVCDDITSYVMKNVVFWMSELVPVEQFREVLLIERLMQALCYLKHCVKMNYLPNYMIPERNLLARKLTYPQRLELGNMLDELTELGGAVLLKIGQLKYIMILMYKVPDLMLSYGSKRNMVEQTYNELRTTTNRLCFSSIVNGDIKNSDQLIEYAANSHDVIASRKKLHDLVIPEWRSMKEQGIDENTISTIFLRRLDVFLS